MGFFNFFKSIGRAIKGLFVKIDITKAKAVLKQIDDMTEIALYAANVVAKLTPTPIDDLVIIALRNLKLTAREVVENSNQLLQNGQKQALAAEILKQKMIEIVKQGDKISIGSTLLDTVEKVLNIDSDLLKSAVTTAWSVIKRAK